MTSRGAGRRPTSRARGVAALVMAALVVAACGGATASPETSPGPAAATDGNPPSSGPAGSLQADADGFPIITDADLADPASTSRHERALVRQLRDEVGMPAFIGPNGAAALATLDQITDAYAQAVLEAVSTALDTGTFPTSASPDRLAGLVASTVDMPPPAPAPDDLEISMFADTGFTTSAILAVASAAVQRAGEEGGGTISIPDSKDQTSDGLRQQVDMSMVWTVKFGGGRVSVTITMTATDRISTVDGSFAGLYTSTSEGHFDVNACPDENGRAEGTYSFETKQELNDVSGASNRQSGGGKSVNAPFVLLDGDDAHLVQAEANLDLRADGHGPGSPGGPGPTGPFDWGASEQVRIVQPASGGAGAGTWSGGGVQVTGTGGQAARGSTFFPAAMAAMFIQLVGKEAETFWRSGKCIDLKPSRDSGKVRANEEVEVTVESKGAFDGASIEKPIEATFSGKKSIDPTGDLGAAPAKFTFTAGAKKDDKGIVDLKQTSKRGIGTKHLEYTVGEEVAIAISGTLHEPGADLRLTVARTPLPATDRGFEANVTGQVKGKVDVLGCSRSASTSATYRVIAAPDETDPELFHLFVAQTSGLDPEKEITCHGVTTRVPIPATEFSIPFLGTGSDGSVPVRLDQPTTLSDSSFGDVRVTVTLSRRSEGS